MPDLQVITDRYGEELRAAAVPGIVLRVPRGVSAIRATVCGDCGHLEFNVADPAEMWAAWRQHNV